MNVRHYTRLRELGLNVLAPEYRGYNGLEGLPSEATVAADARAAYDYLRDREGIPAERLVIFGWSLGAAVAVGLASTVDARAVVLEGAPASIADIGQEQYPLFPVRWIIRNPFNAIETVGGIRAPLLFLHSPEDTIVPLQGGTAAVRCGALAQDLRRGAGRPHRIERDRPRRVLRRDQDVPADSCHAAAVSLTNAPKDRGAWPSSLVCRSIASGDALSPFAWKNAYMCLKSNTAQSGMN